MAHSERIGVGVGLDCILAQVSDTVDLLLHGLLHGLLNVWHDGVELWDEDE
jgi:hypothetical protein